MPTTTIQDLGFVEVAGTLEPGAIAGEIARDAHNRVGELVALVDNWLRSAGSELTEEQKIELVSTALRCMDGFERSTIDTLVEQFARIETAGGDAR